MREKKKSAPARGVGGAGEGLEQRLSWLGPLCGVPGPQRGRGVRSPATGGTNSHRLLKEHEASLEPNARSPVPLGGHVAPFLQKKEAARAHRRPQRDLRSKPQSPAKQAAAFFRFSLRDPHGGCGGWEPSGPDSTARRGIVILPQCLPGPRWELAGLGAFHFTVTPRRRS